jgi:hypothetical protein
MKAKIKDYLTLLQTDRKTQIIAGVGLALILALFFNRPPEPKKNPFKKPAAPQKISAGGAGTAEAYEDLVTSFAQDLKVLQESQKRLEDRQDSEDKRFEEYDAKTAAIFTKILERMNSGEMGGSNANNNGSMMQSSGMAPVDVESGDNGATAGQGNGAFAPASQELEPFGLENAEPAPPPLPPREKSAFVAVGDSVRIKLLAGVNAPTDGTPYPVVFKLHDDIIGPDGSRLPLGEARLIAAAQGSLVDSRALFRLTDLSVRLPDGQRRTYKVDGWVVGEDGIRGMKGKLIDHLGKAIGAATGIGAAKGASEALKATQSTNFISDDGTVTQLASGDAASLLATSALAGGLGSWGDIIKDRINQLVPQVEVLSGREGTAVFAKSIVIDGLFEAMEDDNSGFASLD